MPCRSLSQRVTPVLFGAGTVAANPRPRDLVSVARSQTRLSKITIRYRRTAGVDPASFSPPGQMPRHCTMNVLRIRDDFDEATPFQRRKTSDDRLKLHAIVGGVRLRADKFLFDRTASQQACPTS